MIIYVGNLSPETTQEELRRVFQPHGEVSSVSLLTDLMGAGRGSGPCRGFGFVVMPDRAQARGAISALHLHEVRGRPMTVQVARPVNARKHRR
jgi:RNA recognition motif-containing protein